ncbi:hypothetical protein SAMN04515647_4135 [Cohaesibacter sp. ES.047]|uniref:hypothetical protein n=1 Tax=Cohaesibacter sp. ES.047 TaxID=1798205 RepID=UPI000BB6A2BF|nr:hypothetical protein [Cohaesibacter sp. ES.047]SNY93814.1 hypothetical protein SAMN04515647_4135 [Cohaesibacter sp. ES.047]
MSKDITDEDQCRFVSSRGILKSTKTHVAEPKSSMRKIPWEFAKRLNSRAEVIYLTPEMLPTFAKYHLWRIRTPFTLVTGDSDWGVNERDLTPALLNKLLNNRYLDHWFAQNLDHQHAKLTAIPIGLDYHTLSHADGKTTGHDWGNRVAPLRQEQEICQIHAAAGPIDQKKTQAFSNWHFAADRGDRQQCLSEFPAETAFYQSTFLTRRESWQLNASFAFTISPLGNGLDCHRTWEALLLGSIPVVKSSPLDSLYQDLPVVILDEWSDFTTERMHYELERASHNTYDFSRLHLSYWLDVIAKRQPAVAERMTIDAFRQQTAAYGRELEKKHGSEQSA